MKKDIIQLSYFVILLFTIFSSLYTKISSASYERQGFFSIELGNKFPHLELIGEIDTYNHFWPFVNVKYGRKFGRQSAEVGISFNDLESDLFSIIDGLFEYNYDFFNREKWISGLSVSAIFDMSVVRSKKGKEDYYKHSLNLGVFLNRPVSSNSLLSFEVGLADVIIIERSTADMSVTPYISAGARWHFH